MKSVLNSFRKVILLMEYRFAVTLMEKNNDKNKVIVQTHKHRTPNSDLQLNSFRSTFVVNIFQERLEYHNFSFYSVEGGETATMCKILHGISFPLTFSVQMQPKSTLRSNF